ncbi:DNA ligase D [Rhodomicrobium vannielii ATCC 17100]|uniref:DNA ligase (ATP) n=1 Tax=Rhodomicrobium vannielii (strain ATCC 17100 / DSM 162 / LMG 4299 / NCIMB 10020 / ATH 3.1.1) TaxID=648757 RepID=E3HZV9_RHOVT|nr:DNA ligase D [Rhodomicrobium vannielii]ADP69910.1 DNA ligase D [Rhodomicrobium vannielii ATCC 17100]
MPKGAASAPAKSKRGAPAVSAKGDLTRYRQKRDFAKTPEPSGTKQLAKAPELRFVIQKHAARRLHYDLRLELDGVYKSWAVTKGPSLDPAEKRLAVHVEDHPLDYGDFEGIIPPGEYGGGTVMVWDRGTWEPEGDPAKGYAKGHLAFTAHGEKLKGRWHLIHIKPRPGEKDQQWLLFKSDDEFARAAGDGDILEDAPDSVATGRSIDEIARDGEAVWSGKAGLVKGELSPAEGAEEWPALPKRKRRRTLADATGAAGAIRADRRASDEDAAKTTSRRIARRVAKAPVAQDADPVAAAPPPAKSPARVAVATTAPAGAAKAVAGAKKAPFPGFVAPCLAQLCERAPDGDNWLHEIKFDGYRVMALIENGRVRLMTRSGLDWTERFPAIAAAFAAFPAASAIVDGEAVVEDHTGVSSFSALQEALSTRKSKADIVFFAFDLLYFDGYDLRGASLESRKAALAPLVEAAAASALRYSDHVIGHGPAMVENACRLGLEGIVSKRLDAPYRSGRHGAWLKTKCTNRQEFVVGGYAPSTAMHGAIGSLALGAYDNGALLHVGRAGTGFTQATAKALFKQLQPLRRATSPFANALSSEEKRGLVHVEPQLVAEVEFRGWTGDRHLRHAAFKGLREDKPATEVLFEMPRQQTAPDAAARERTTPARARATPGKGGTVDFEGIRLTHPDRILWEGQGLTKLGLADYYAEVADHILPFITGRPLALVRCPSGQGGDCFYQKRSFAGLTDAVEVVPIADKDGDTEALVIHDLRGLINLVQSNVLEIHPWGARIDDLERPDTLIFDLDPGDGVGFEAVMDGAREVRRRLGDLGIESWVKTTGGKGLHVVSPLVPDLGWEELKAFAQGIAQTMERDAPQRFVSTMAKKARDGKIYVDYLRNGRGSTAIAPYSTRAREGAPVATPLGWDELGPALTPQRFTVETMGRRLAALKSDPWAGYFENPQRIESLGGRAARQPRRRPKS